MKQTDSKKKKSAKTSDKADGELMYWDENSKSIILQF